MRNIYKDLIAVPGPEWYINVYHYLFHIRCLSSLSLMFISFSSFSWVLRFIIIPANHINFAFSVPTGYDTCFFCFVFERERAC